MRTGIFCFYENYAGDFQRVYVEQTELIRYADQLGFDEAWIPEHHFGDFAATPSLMVLLAYLAAATRQIRVGAAALLAFQDRRRCG